MMTEVEEDKRERTEEEASFLSVGGSHCTNRRANALESHKQQQQQQHYDDGYDHVMTCEWEQRRRMMMVMREEERRPTTTKTKGGRKWVRGLRSEKLCSPQ